MQLMSNEKIAYVLTIFAYREVGIWENYHAQKKTLDMSVYDEMCRSVKAQLDVFLPYIRYLRMSAEEWLDQGSALSQEDKDYMLGFVFISRSSHEWIPARTIDGCIISVGTLSKTFSGDGSTTTFTLTDKPENIVGVTVDGAAVTAYTYEKTTGTITFTTAPASGKTIVVTY